MRIERGWEKDGKCRALPKHESDRLFFGAKGNHTQEAKRFCKGIDGSVCPVLESCLLSAVIYGEVGVWGGTTQGERERVQANVRDVVKQRAIDDGVYREYVIDFGSDRPKNPKPTELEAEVVESGQVVQTIDRFIANGTALFDELDGILRAAEADREVEVRKPDECVLAAKGSLIEVVPEGLPVIEDVDAFIRSLGLNLASNV